MVMRITDLILGHCRCLLYKVEYSSSVVSYVQFARMLKKKYTSLIGCKVMQGTTSGREEPYLSLRVKMCRD